MRSQRSSLSIGFRHGLLCAAAAAVSLGWHGAAQSRSDCDQSWAPEYTSKPLERRFVFATVEVTPDGGPSYEVSLAPCGERLCRLEVRLRDEREVYDEQRVGVCTLAQEPRLNTRDDWYGVGDLLQPDKGLTVWSIGGFGLNIFTRPLDLAQGLRGVLVHLSSGGEHTWRGHYLLVALGKKLVLAWKAEEIGGDDSAVVDLEDIDGDGFPEILFFMERLVGQMDEASNRFLGTARAAVYRWNHERKEIEQIPIADSGVPIYAAIAGVFQSAEDAFTGSSEGVDACYAARNACIGPGADGCGVAFEACKEAAGASVQSRLDCYQDWRDCAKRTDSCDSLPGNVARFGVFPTDPFPQLAHGKYMLAVFTWRKAYAEKAIETLRMCQSRMRGFVAELIFFPSPRRRFSPE